MCKAPGHVKCAGTLGVIGGLGVVALALSNQLASDHPGALWLALAAVALFLAAAPLVALSKSAVASSTPVKILLCLAAAAALAFAAAHAFDAAGTHKLEFLFPVGFLGTAILLPLAGAAILATKSWSGWPAFMPLILGLGFVAVIFANDDSQLPMAGIGALQALLGLAVTKAPAKA